MRMNPEQKIEKVPAKERYIGEAKQHVYLDVDRKEIMATDGYCAVILPVEVEDGDHSGLLSIESVKAIRKNKGQAACNGSVACKDASYTRPTSDTSFPSVSDAVPREPREGEVLVCLDAALLKKVADALGNAVVCLAIVPGTMEPIRISTSRGEGYAALMPCRE